MSNDSDTFHLANRFNKSLSLKTFVIVCPNTACAEIVISASLHKDISSIVSNT